MVEVDMYPHGHVVDSDSGVESRDGHRLHPGKQPGGAENRDGTAAQGHGGVEVEDLEDLLGSSAKGR